MFIHVYADGVCCCCCLCFLGLGNLLNDLLMFCVVLFFSFVSACSGVVVVCKFLFVLLLGPIVCCDVTILFSMLVQSKLFVVWFSEHCNIMILCRNPT